VFLKEKHFNTHHVYICSTGISLIPGRKFLLL